MGKNIPSVIIEKGDPDVLAFVFAVEAQAALQLHLEKQVFGHVLGDEIRSLPIVGEPMSHESEVRELGAEFLGVKILLLAGIELPVGDAIELVRHEEWSD